MSELQIHPKDIKKFLSNLTLSEGNHIQYVPSNGDTPSKNVAVRVRIEERDPWRWRTMGARTLMLRLHHHPEQSQLHSQWYSRCSNQDCLNPGHLTSQRNFKGFESEPVPKEIVRVLADKPLAVHYESIDAWDAERFWEGVVKFAEDSCWLRYPNVFIDSQDIQYSAPRLSHALMRGLVPQGHQVRVTCGTSGCCNPDHHKLHPVYKKEKPTNR